MAIPALIAKAAKAAAKGKKGKNAAKMSMRQKMEAAAQQKATGLSKKLSGSYLLQAKKNELFAAELDKALAGETSILGSEGKIFAKTFMSQHADTIRGHAKGDYYDVIMESMGTQDLETAYKETLKARDGLGEEIMSYKKLLKSGKASEPVINPITGEVYGGEADIEPTEADWYPL